MRRIVEIAIALVLLLVFAPLFLLVAIGIYIDDGRPIFFKQIRVGKSEQEFKMWKFRTMVSGAHLFHNEELAKHMAASGSFLISNPKDSRVTRLGKLLRRLSIDEFPQLVNVIKGEMAFVGPRPMLPEEVKHLRKEQLPRFTVLPGITGWAQVNGRGALGSEAYVQHDLDYLDRASLLLDLLILARTPWAVLSGRGAS